MPTVPAATDVTTPVEEPTTAMDIFPPDQVPPDGAPERVVEPPAQILPSPLIAVGDAFTVTYASPMQDPATE